MYHRNVIRRLYVHNYRCLENFDLPIGGRSSALLIGKNGSGKSTIGAVLEILQGIGRGTNRVGSLVKSADLSRQRLDVPMRVEIEVDLDNVHYKYSIAFELPSGFAELRVKEESLTAGGEEVFSRSLAQVRLAKSMGEEPVSFDIDWHLVALPIIQQSSPADPLGVFRQWLRRILILRPVPSQITGVSTNDETLDPDPQVLRFGAWFAGLLKYAPAAYSVLDQTIKEVMPDFKDIRNPPIGPEARMLFVQFSNKSSTMLLPFSALSDGEKCFMIYALVVAAVETNRHLLCFWDEPDSHLALHEVGHFILKLRQVVDGSSQLLVTSHNPEAIRRFSDENTFLLYRRSHLEPAQIRPLSEIERTGDLVTSLIHDGLEP